jgi:hypothetical protein
MNRVVFTFGELRVAMETAEPGIGFRIEPEYRAFATESEVEADCTLRWRVAPVSVPSRTPLAESVLWRVWKHADGSEETIFFWGGRLPYLSLTFDADFRSARVVRVPDRTDPAVLDAGEYPFSEYVASRLLGRRGAVELHASAVVFGGLAYVFVGDSGAGKTTISRLAAEAGGHVLTDDRTVIAIRDDVPYAWGTPWHGAGKQSSAGFAPVDALCLLAQDVENRTVPLAPGLAVKELFVRAIQSNVDQMEVEACLQTLERLVALRPVRRLHFARSVAAIQTVLDSGAAARDGLTFCTAVTDDARDR